MNKTVTVLILTIVAIFVVGGLRTADALNKNTHQATPSAQTSITPAQQKVAQQEVASDWPRLVSFASSICRIRNNLTTGKARSAWASLDKTAIRTFEQAYQLTSAEYDAAQASLQKARITSMKNYMSKAPTLAQMETTVC